MRLTRSGPLVAAIVAAVSCVGTPAITSPTPGIGSPSPSPALSASATATPEPSAAPPSLRVPNPSEGVRAHALGILRGNWIFVGKQVPYPQNIWAEVQIWAIPLDTGAPRLALAYDVSLGGAPEAIFDNTPYLRRAFSPNGTRMVVSVGGQLMVVDIVSGQVRPLGVAGYFPAWSKDGSRIAFLFELPVGTVVPPEGAIGVIPAGGGSVRQVAVVGYARQSVEWSPDGSMLIVAQPAGIAIVDAASRQVIRRIPEISEPGSSFAHWRSKAPQIVVSVTGCERATTRVIALENVTGGSRTLVDTGERCASLNLRDPRWNPAGDEVLYVSARAQPGAEPTEFRTHVLDPLSGRDTLLPLVAWEATWTWDGAQIAYVARGSTSSYGNAVRLWRRDGTEDRELMRATGRDVFFSLASLSY